VAINAHSSWNRNHVAAFTARSTSRNQARSTPRSARTTAPACSMVITPGALVVVAVPPTGAIAVTTGTRVGGAPSAGTLRRLRPCSTRIDAAARYHADAPPPTPPRPARRIPRRCVPWPHRSSGVGADTNPAPRLRTVNYIVDHMCEPISFCRFASCRLRRPRFVRAPEPALISCSSGGAKLFIHNESPWHSPGSTHCQSLPGE
jgi:hypothetical protein